VAASGSGSGSAEAAAAGSGSAGAIAPTIADGSGSAVGSGSAAGSATPDAAGSGSSTLAVDNVAIQIVSTPPGAHIFVDNTDTGKVTPAPLTFPKGNSKVQISLRLKGYAPTGSRVDTSTSSEQRYELAKAKPQSVGQGSGTGSSRPTTPTGTTKPTTPNNSDPDGLMRP
jgi:hypothetical protein